MALRRAPRAEPMTRTTGGLLAVAALAFAGLLVVYVHVLEVGVRQGEVRRIAWADQARTTWRCNALSLEVERKKCLGAILALSDTVSASGLPAAAWRASPGTASAANR